MEWKPCSGIPFSTPITPQRLLVLLLKNNLIKRRCLATFLNTLKFVNKLRYASYFQLSSRCLEIWSNTVFPRSFKRRFSKPYNPSISHRNVVKSSKISPALKALCNLQSYESICRLHKTTQYDYQVASKFTFVSVITATRTSTPPVRHHGSERTLSGFVVPDAARDEGNANRWDNGHWQRRRGLYDVTTDRTQRKGPREDERSLHG